MFDNGDRNPTAVGARVLQIDIDTSADPDEATILRSWEMRTITTHSDLTCPGLGNAVMIPGTSGKNVLATCGPFTTIQELDEYDGLQTTDPVLQIALDTTADSSTGEYDLCITGSDPTTPGRFYRAWPLLELGEF